MDEEVEELEEIKELEEIDKVEKVEAYPQYMHPSHGLNRPQPQTIILCQWRERPAGIFGHWM